MPPKRKRAQLDAEPSTSRLTRSSTRGAKKGDGQGANATWSNSAASRPDAPGGDDDIQEISVPPNKASKSGDASKSKATKTRGTRWVLFHNILISRITKLTLPVTAERVEVASLKGTRLMIDAKRVVSDVVTPDMYSQQAAEALFSRFADKDTPDVIGAEGFERLCNEAQIPLDGALPLLLAWQCDSQEMGKISKKEWMGGTTALRVSSLASFAAVLDDFNNLIVLGKPPVASRPSMSHVKSQKNAAHDRTRYDSYVADTGKAFSSFYNFCFALAKPESSRNIDMETACALWSVLLAPQFPLIVDVTEFINDTGSYKGVNKDLWNMMLEFCRDTRRDLSNFEADGAWPSVIDEFVRWKNAQTAIQPVEASISGT